MIEASFENANARSAAVSGAYQYDAGQRIRMHGLPSPEELANKDDCLSGDRVTVQAQYAYAGDGRTEMRLATYDADTETWTAAVPDAYLTRSEDVHVYVYVGYGQTEESMRAKTCYEAVFRPVGRPAPDTEVSPDQINAWDALVQEVNMTIAGANAAASEAGAAAIRAGEMAEAAEKRIEAYFDGLKKTQVRSETLEAGADAAVSVEEAEEGAHRVITFSIPRGEPGVFSINGKAVSNNADVLLTAEDVGAMPDTHRTVFEFAARIPVNGWNGSSGALYRYAHVPVEGLLESDRPVIDIDVEAISGISASVLEDVRRDWARVTKIEAADGQMTVYCIGGTPTYGVPVKLLCVR